MIILQEFKEILWNILKKLKQLLKKFCVNFVPVKYVQILEHILLLGKLRRKVWGNLEGILLQNFVEIFRKV